MHIIRRDQKNNRLYLTIYGIISLAEAKKIKELIIKEVNELQPGFVVINDISKLVNADEKAAVYLDEANNHSLAKKVKMIIRVVGHSKTGLVLFAKHTSKPDSLEIKYVPTLKEAEDLLAGG